MAIFKIFKKNSDYFYLILLFLLNIIIYHRWLSFSVFTYSDWIFYFREALVDQITPSVWSYLGMGNVDIMLWKLPVYLMNGFFGKLGFNYNVAEKFIVFWPIISGLSLSSYLLVRYIINSKKGAFIGALAFSFNTYFLSINSQGHEFLPASFVFANFALLFYIKNFKEKKFFYSLISGIFLALTASYDLRSLYIILAVFSLYFIFDLYANFNNRKKYFFSYIIFALVPHLLFILLSLYWILPILLTGYINQGGILGRLIFGSDFYNLQSSFTTFFPFWTGHETAWFTVQRIPLYFWIYPTLAFLGFIMSKKSKNIVFFAGLSLLGIFLSKQADIPFPQLYSWLYTHVPGFNAFREASKFNYLIAIGYAVLIGSFVVSISKYFKNSKKNLAPFFLIVLSFVFLWNSLPIFLGTIRQLYIPHKIPQEFVELNNFITSKPEFFRTVWINMTHWAIFDRKHPAIDAAFYFDNQWQKYAYSKPDKDELSSGKKLIMSIQSPVVKRLLDISSVRYLIIPLYDHETGSDVKRNFGESYKFYERGLSDTYYLKKVEEMPSNILVYENKSFRPHIYTTFEEESLSKEVPFQVVSYQSPNASEFHVKLKNVKKKIWLNFSESYHEGWKIRIGSFKWSNFFDKNYYISDKFHLKNEAGYNSFIIDPDNLCSKYNCQKNSDGSYDIALTLYFSPQSYLYLGMIIGASVLIFVLFILFKYKNYEKE